MDKLVTVLANQLQIGDRTMDDKWTVKSIRVTSGGNAVVTFFRVGRETEFTYSPRTSLDVFRETKSVTDEELDEMRTGLETWLK